MVPGMEPNGAQPPGDGGGGGVGGGRNAVPHLNVALAGEDASVAYDSLRFAAFASPAVVSRFAPETGFGSPLTPAYDPDERGLEPADAFGMFRMTPASPSGSVASPGVYLPHAPAATSPSLTNGFAPGSNVVVVTTPPPSDGEDASRGSARPITAYPGSPLSQANPILGPSAATVSLDALLNMQNTVLPDVAAGDVVARNPCDGSPVSPPSPRHYNISGQVPASLGAAPLEAAERAPLSMCLSPEGLLYPEQPALRLFPFGAAGGSSPVSPVATEANGSQTSGAARRQQQQQQQQPARKRQQHAGSKAADDAGRKMFPCDAPGCHKNFKRAEHLTRHFHSVHTSEKPFRCPVPTCGKHFSRSDNLNQHLHTHKLKGRQTPREKKPPANLLQDLDRLLSATQLPLLLPPQPQQLSGGPAAALFYPTRQQNFPGLREYPLQRRRPHLQQPLHRLLEGTEAGRQRLMAPPSAAERATHGHMQILVSPGAAAAGAGYINPSPQPDHLTFRLDETWTDLLKAPEL